MTQAQIIGINIKRLREERYWNQEDLAKKLQISRKAISAWETGRACPRMGVVEQLKQIFNCSTSDILNEKKDNDLQQPTTDQLRVLAFEAAKKVVPSDDEDEQRIIKIYRSLSPEKKRALLNKAIDLMVQ